MRFCVVARGEFAERLGDDAVDVCEDARDAKRDADVAIGYSGLNLLREVLALRLPHGIAARLARELDLRVWNLLEAQRVGRHVRGD